MKLKPAPTLKEVAERTLAERKQSSTKINICILSLIVGGLMLGAILAPAPTPDVPKQTDSGGLVSYREFRERCGDDQWKLPDRNAWCISLGEVFDKRLEQIRKRDAEEAARRARMLRALNGL